MPKEIHSSYAISIPTAKKLLKKREEDAWSQKEELSYIQKEALDHAIAASRCDAKDAEMLIVDLKKDFKLSNLNAITLSNILPNTIDEVRQLTSPDSKKMNTETIQAILDRVLKVKTITKVEKTITSEEEFHFEEKEVNPNQVPSDLHD